MSAMRRLTREQTVMLFRRSAPDDPGAPSLDRRRRDRAEQRIELRRALVDAKRRMDLLETTVDHLTAKLGQANDELARLRDVRRLSMGERIRLNLVRDFPRLRERHPDGIILRHLVEHFGFDKAIIRLTITEMAREGKVRWIRIKGCHEMALVLPDEAVIATAAPIMTAARRRTFDLLRQRARDGFLRISVTALSSEIGIHPSTLNYDIACLIRDERLFLFERGIGNHPNVYSFERPAMPLSLSPSLERKIGLAPGYPRKPRSPVSKTPSIVVEFPVKQRALAIRPLAPTLMRRSAGSSSRSITEQLMGDPVTPRHPVATPASSSESTLDRDGLRLQREWAKMHGL